MTPEPNTDRARQAVLLHDVFGWMTWEQAVAAADRLSDAGLWVGGPWQPIDTVDLNAEVLLYGPGDGVWVDDGVMAERLHATHWAPLPPFPTRGGPR